MTADKYEDAELKAKLEKDFMEYSRKAFVAGQGPQGLPVQ